MIRGRAYNITNFSQMLEDSHGANSEVEYIGFAFKNLPNATTKGPFQTLKMKKSDYFILTLTIPADFLSKHNLLNFTGYFYDYTNNNQTTTVFASFDKTVQLFDRLRVGQTIRILMTASKQVPRLYDYLVRIPAEYLNCCDVCPLLRIGIYSKRPVTNWITCEYYRSNLVSSTYTATEIQNSWPIPLPPKFNDGQKVFEDAMQAFISLNYFTVLTYPYLTNVYGPGILLESFYQAIQVDPPANLQANNTGESYFTSNNFYLNGYYLYILTVNQKLQGAGITSNIQIYDRSNNSALYTVNTSDSLPNMNARGYPITKNTYPEVTLMECSPDLFPGNPLMAIVERVCYHPDNYFHPDSNKVNNAIAFIGPIVPSSLFTRYNGQRLSNLVS